MNVDAVNCRGYWLNSKGCSATLQSHDDDDDDDNAVGVICWSSKIFGLLCLGFIVNDIIIVKTNNLYYFEQSKAMSYGWK